MVRELFETAGSKHPLGPEQFGFIRVAPKDPSEDLAEGIVLDP
jgi:hypothetical protein